MNIQNFLVKKRYAVLSFIILIVSIFVIIFFVSQPATTVNTKTENIIGNIGGLTEAPKNISGDNNNNPKIDSGIAITKDYIFIVKKGDTLALLARKALLEYERNVNMIYANSQRMFVETNLIKDFNFRKVQIGETIIFNLNAIQILYEKSQYLTEKQINKWNFYAKKVNYNIL